jgi:hypothetical protein
MCDDGDRLLTSPYAETDPNAYCPETVFTAGCTDVVTPEGPLIPYDHATGVAASATGARKSPITIVAMSRTRLPGSFNIIIQSSPFLSENQMD